MYVFVSPVVSNMEVGNWGAYISAVCLYASKGKWRRRTPRLEDELTVGFCWGEHAEGGLGRRVLPAGRPSKGHELWPWERGSMYWADLDLEMAPSGKRGTWVCSTYWTASRVTGVGNSCLTWDLGFLLQRYSGTVHSSLGEPTHDGKEGLLFMWLNGSKCIFLLSKCFWQLSKRALQHLCVGWVGGCGGCMAQHGLGEDKIPQVLRLNLVQGVLSKEKGRMAWAWPTGASCCQVLCT